MRSHLLGSCMVAATLALAACGSAVDSGAERADRSASPLSLSPAAAAAPVSSAACGTANVVPGSAPWIVKAPKVYFVYWGQYWQTGTGVSDRAGYDATWSTAASSPAFYQRLTEYGVGQGRWTGSAAITTPFPASGTITDGQAGSELVAEIQSGKLPATDNNTIYVLMLPPSLTDTTDTNGVKAHHTDVPVGNALAAFAVMEYNGSPSDHSFNGLLISHEISEAATDPDLFSGYRDTITGFEIGDLCVEGPYGLAGAPMQRMWSQRACGCIMRRDPSNPDFNGDWRADLAVTGTASDLASTQVGVALATGQGGFLPTLVSTTDFNTFATTPGATVLAGDFDGDGNTDLAAVGVASWNGVKIAYAKGDGTFGTTVTVATPFGATASVTGTKVIATDVNGDGMADLVATGSPGATLVAVAFGGAGTFRLTSVASPFASLASSATSLAAGDLNNDGYDDLIAIGSGGTTIPVAFSNADGTFRTTNLASAFASTLSSAGAKVVVGDVDNDNMSDLIVAGSPSGNAVGIGHSNGDGTFTATTPENGQTSFPSSASQPGAILVGGDFNSDHYYDIAATGVAGWTSVPVQLTLEGGFLTTYKFSFVNGASDFAGYAGASNNRVVAGVGYASAPTGPPAPPSALGANAASATSIALKWTASPTPGVTYGVFRGTVSTFAPSAGNVVAGSVSGTSYTDTGLAPSSTYYYYVKATNAGGISGSSNEASATTLGGTILQINAGGAGVSPFAADEDFAGGATIAHANVIDLSAVTNPAPAAVYQTARTGNFSYTIGGVSPGSTHTIRLHFAETYFSSAGSRVFNVTINGAPVLNRFDIYSAAGAKNKAVIEQFSLAARATGDYVIQLRSVVNSSLLSGIELQ